MKIKKTLFSTSIEISPDEIEHMASLPMYKFDLIVKNFINAISDFFKTLNK